MTKVSRFVIWICSKFGREEIIKIVEGLLEVLMDQNPDVKPRDYFKEKHPNYRKFTVDREPPLTSPPQSKKKLNYKTLLEEYSLIHGEQLHPITRRKKTNIPSTIRCRHCNAPAPYLYCNDGKKAAQIHCKICRNFSMITTPPRKRKTKYWCPHCGWALYRWKETTMTTSYKCDNDRCPAYLRALKELNPREHLLRSKKSSQFKLRYQYREYHFTRTQLHIPGPYQTKVDLAKVFNTDNVVGLVLTFHISFALPARKTAAIMRYVFQIPMSYQTVLNYAEAAAYHCHSFNRTHKGSVDVMTAGDETYIKINGKQAYTFLTISAQKHKIAAYHIAETRGVLPAARTLKETMRTYQHQQPMTFVSDGNPAYSAAIHFLNADAEGKPINHKKVIGLQNLDDESEQYRPLKQLIERLNRTYKYHTRSAHGFKGKNGALVLTTLFVTHYNFLRPHMSLKYQVPIPMEELSTAPTYQAKWCRILDMARKAA